MTNVSAEDLVLIIFGMIACAFFGFIAGRNSRE